jgi:hypothetical protein
MSPLTCAECERPLLPHESLVRRLGRIFHAACHERHLAEFELALRRGAERPDVADVAPPPSEPLRLIA